MFHGIWILLLAILPVTAYSKAIQVDNVLVVKSERALYLRSGSSIVKKYPVSLGKKPHGNKIKEGDKKTPEGSYVLDWRNPKSKFYKSIHISYPTEEQSYKAEKHGINPGGMIMIHGLPKRSKMQLEGLDWTDGCIAVSNHHMDEIWHFVADGTPIHIYP